MLTLLHFNNILVCFHALCLYCNANIFNKLPKETNCMSSASSLKYVCCNVTIGFSKIEDGNGKCVKVTTTRPKVWLLFPFTRRS